MTPPTPAAIAAAKALHDSEYRHNWGLAAIPEVAAIIDRHISATASAGWQGMESAPKDRLVHLWIAATPRGERWSAEDHLLAYCYYDDICSEWRSSRPQGRLVCVPERFVTHWRDIDPPSAPSPTKV